MQSMLYCKKLSFNAPLGQNYADIRSKLVEETLNKSCFQYFTVKTCKETTLVNQLNKMCEWSFKDD